MATFEKAPKTEYTNDGFGSECYRSRVIMRSDTHAMIAHYGIMIGRRGSGHFATKSTTKEKIHKEWVEDIFGEGSWDAYEQVKSRGTMLVGGGGERLRRSDQELREEYAAAVKKAGTRFSVEGIETGVHCRQCNKMIEAATQYHSFDYPADDSRYPKSLAECQRLSNHQIVETIPHRLRPDVIGSFRVWDGESTKSKYFCDLECAAKFAVRAIEAGIDLPADNSFVAKEKKDYPSSVRHGGGETRKPVTFKRVDQTTGEVTTFTA